MVLFVLKNYGSAARAEGSTNKTEEMGLESGSEKSCQ